MTLKRPTFSRAKDTSSQKKSTSANLIVKKKEGEDQASLRFTRMTVQFSCSKISKPIWLIKGMRVNFGKLSSAMQGLA